MKHSLEHKGLQEHSIGNEYPWSVANKGGWIPFHCITGEWGPAGMSYKECENWIENQKAYECVLATDPEPTKQPTHFCDGCEGCEGDASRSCLYFPDIPCSKPEPEPMVEYTFLIPLSQDKTRVPHLTSTWQWLDDKLSLHFGGFTRSGLSVGTWTDSHGSVVSDTSRVYRVAMPASRYSELVEVLELCKTSFRQQSIYVAETAIFAELV